MSDNKIGVFGDSFAEDTVFIHSFEEHFEEHSMSWIKLIGAQTYALGGSDIQWSFLQFEKNHNKYDQVIFVLTNPLRLSLGSDILTVPNSSLAGEKKLKQAMENYKKSSSIKDLEIYHTWDVLNKITNVLMSINQEYVNRQYLFYNLVIERIKQLRPDVKFIKAFPNHDNEFPIITDPMSSKEIKEILNLYNRTVPVDNKSLKDIQVFENDKMSIAQDYYYDARIGHLTDESHKILARLINNWLKTDEMFFDFDMKQFRNINPDKNRYTTNSYKSYEDWKEYYLKDITNE